MNKNLKKKGSITVFAAVSLMLVAALLFVLLEAARLQEFRKIAKAETASATESVFAHYNKALWEEYHLLLLDDGSSGDTFDSTSRKSYLLKNLNENLQRTQEDTGSLFEGECISTDFSSYTLITDGNGVAFEGAVSAYMKNNAAYEIGNQLSEWYEEIKGYEESDVDVQEKIATAIEDVNGEVSSVKPLLRQPLRDTDETDIDNSQPEDEDAESGTEILNAVGNQSPDGVLALVLPGDSKISGKAFDAAESLEKRSLSVGTETLSEEGNANSLWTVAYLMAHLSNYTRQEENHALSYELEYVVGGKDSDEANLKKVIWRLLLVREVSNFIFLENDSQRSGEADAIALALSTLAESPELEEPIKTGILAAWAYTESILDIRALLQGKRIALYKNSAQWSSELLDISALLDAKTTAEECKGGLSYTEYLGVFALLTGKEKRAYRALESMELTIREKSGDQAVKIDQMILEAKIETGFSYPTAFIGMEELTKGKGQKLYLSEECFYSYRKAGG